MKESPLKQRVFDDLFSALALCNLLHRHELQEIVAGLRAAAPHPDDDGELFSAVADAVSAYAEGEAQA